jgi:hypothetical protein
MGRRSSPPQMIIINYVNPILIPVTPVMECTSENRLSTYLLWYGLLEICWGPDLSICRQMQMHRVGHLNSQEKLSYLIKRIVYQLQSSGYRLWISLNCLSKDLDLRDAQSRNGRCHAMEANLVSKGDGWFIPQRLLSHLHIFVENLMAW